MTKLGKVVQNENLYFFLQGHFHTKEPQGSAIYYGVLLIAVILYKGHHLNCKATTAPYGSTHSSLEQ